MGKLKFANVTIEGRSIAGVETNIRIPEFSLNFDIGRCPNRALKMNILAITHGHMDHLAGLPYYVATRQFYGMKPPTIIVPHFLAGHVRMLLDAWESIQGFPMNAQIVSLEPGGRKQIRGDLIIEGLAVDHRMDAFGYVVYSHRKKLKREYLDLSQAEIVTRKRAGEDLFYIAETPWVAFTGDTLITALDRHEVFRRARLLICEATFLDDQRGGKQRAHLGGHIHLDELIERAADFHNEAIVLGHFSQIYKDAMIRSIINGKANTVFDNRLVPLLRV